MGVFEIIMNTKTTEITQLFDMDDVNDCVEHRVKPRFFRGETRKSAMLSVRCLAESCARCCDATYDKTPEKEIVAIWNKWNPKSQKTE